MERRAHRMTPSAAAATVPASNAAPTVDTGSSEAPSWRRSTTPREKEAADCADHVRFPCRAWTSTCHWTEAQNPIPLGER